MFCIYSLFGQKCYNRAMIINLKAAVVGIRYAHHSDDY
jgi:hypothetical protein